MSAPEAALRHGTASAVRRPTVGVVTVTYNSDRFFPTFMRSLAAQTVPADLVLLVDSGSTNADFLDQVSDYSFPVQILRESNVGVCSGNNIGWRLLRDFDYVLFLNPDAFLAPDFLERSIAYMEDEPSVGMVTPSLLRYDVEAGRPLDLIDTTGVVRNHLGFLKERDQGSPAACLSQYTIPNEIPWLCTAVALGRRDAMEAVVEQGNQLFDESFFMYKDDTDLSWRVRRAGWKIIHHPGLLGYHCRGWQDRKSVSRKARLLTARNEIKMCLKNRSPFVVIGVFKYALVGLFNL
jgi:N-acetylglucosaminyl-diphospho-decaprenol L-rhamnosyltransferase